MKKTKILTMLGVLLAMGLTACGGGGKSSKTPESKPASASQSASAPASQAPQSQPASSQAPAGLFEDVADPDGHHFGAESDVAADAELGTVAMKKAACADNDNVVKFAVNQSVVTFASGSSNKSGTPEGYVKLSSNNQSLSFKVKMDKLFSGKLFFLGRMDGFSTDGNRTVGLYRQGSPNIKVEINGKAIDLSPRKDFKYTDAFGEDYVSTDLESPSNYLSHEGYVLIGDVLLNKGANEIKYTRLASQNMIVRDFVFVGQELDGEWGPAQTVAATETTIAYTKSVNLIDGRIKVEWKAMDGTLSEGAAIKANTPAGFLKLDANNQKMSYAFNFDADLDGQIYQRGAMDGYPSNANQTYFSQTKGAQYGNFEVKVNGSNVYIGDKRDVTYASMLGNAAAIGEASIGEGYSEVKDCLIGDAFLKNGANTASFERIDSYNLAISHFVFIGKASAAAHVNPAADAAYSGQDDASHWQVAENDAFKFNRGEHKWIADESNPDVPSTCKVKGEKHEKCSICGKTRTVELELAAHTWVADPDKEDVVATTCDGHNISYQVCSVCNEKREVETPSTVAHTWGEKAAVKNSDQKDVVPLECSACQKVGAKMSVGDYSEGTLDGSDYKFKADSDFSFKIVVAKAGSFSLYIGGKYSSGNSGQKLSVTPVTLKVNGQDFDVSTGTFKELGMSSSSIKQFVLAPTVTLKEGENVITIHQGSGGYRLTYGGNLVVYEL